MKPLNRETTDVWISLASANRRILERVETALKAEGLPSLSWYDALFEIEKAGEDGIRPFELKERLLLPQYGLSRLLDRIGKAGLLTRTDFEGDGRGHIVTITQKGKGYAGRHVAGLCICLKGSDRE